MKCINHASDGCKNEAEDRLKSLHSAAGGYAVEAKLIDYYPTTQRSIMRTIEVSEETYESIKDQLGRNNDCSAICWV